MSTYESAYKSLLQGVSQQLPQERLPGQLTAQVNMMSDPVTNLRRRPGLVARAGIPWTCNAEQLVTWFTDISGFRVHVMMNVQNGHVRVYDESFAQLADLDLGAYGIGNARKMRATSVGSEFFICNTDVVPVLTYGTAAFPENRAAFFYILAGAFSRNYTVTVRRTGAADIVASYSTPSGAGAGDAAVSTPEYIAGQLVAQITAGLVATSGHINQDGPYVFLYDTVVEIYALSGVSTQFLIASQSGYVRQAGDLPSRLPPEADGFIMRVGSGDAAQYYRYSAASTEWLESGAAGSPDSITNMPVSIFWDTTWQLNSAAYEGRLAGDDQTNPRHEFMQFGITGMSTYQGRLVLMSGPMVSLSASGRPRRFFRSTVTSVLSGDPIEIGSSTNTSAAYEWAIPFQKDLILFSRAYQALIPSGNQAITPATATVVPTSGHEVDITCGPVNVGRTIMYCTPKSESFFGVLEMIPSQYSDSQYLSQDSTPHLPKFMPGRCRFAVSSSVASMALFAPSGDLHTLIVHEYHWDGDTKVQQSWHQWTFAHAVASAHFASDKIVIVLANEGLIGQCMICTIDPRAGSVSSAGARKSYVDLQTFDPIAYTAHSIPLNAQLLTFDPTFADHVIAVVATGDEAGELIGTTVASGGAALETVLSYPSGNALVGIPFVSSVIPSPPKVTDYQGGVIHTGQATLLRYLVGTKDSAEFTVDVSDRSTTEGDLPIPTLHWDSSELDVGRGTTAGNSISIVPCRTDMRTTAMELSTSGPGEMNIVSLEYVGRYQPKIARKP